MATPVVFNGVNYSVPAFGDVGYAQGPGNLSAYLIAIASGTFQITGGLFSLTAQADFGPNFGLTAVNFTSRTANPATTGVLRLANPDVIAWRNFANSGNLTLGVNATDQLVFSGGIVSTGSNIPSADNLYDLGSPALRWRTAYLGTSLIAPKGFFTNTSDQIVLGTTNTVTLRSTAPSASRIYVMDDVGQNATFVMTEGTQTIAGAKTFGTGGTGAGNATVSMDGGSGADGGARLLFKKNSVTTGAVAHHSVLFGGTGADMVLYSSVANVRLSAQGTDPILTASPTSVTVSVPILGSAGSVSNPAFSYLGDPDTGMYSGGADLLRFAAGSSPIVLISASGLRVTTGVSEVLDGSASAPTYSFTNQAIGMYRIGSNDLGFSTGGALALEIDANRKATIKPAGSSGFIPSLSFAGNYPSASFGQQRTATVSTSAVDIFAQQQWGNLVLVTGYNSSVNLFVDLVMFSGSSTSPTVVSSHTVGASARTYTNGAGNLRLSVASGSYNVNCLAFIQNQG